MPHTYFPPAGGFMLSLQRRPVCPANLAAPVPSPVCTPPTSPPGDNLSPNGLVREAAVGRA